MNLLQYLRESVKSEDIIYSEFLRQYKKKDNSIHIFHEGGDDPSFYSNIIEGAFSLNDKIYYYNARNKDKVYINYSKINWVTHSKQRILFFVDKDYADILGSTYPQDDNIFVTSCYSIENYLVDKYLFCRSLRELIKLDNQKAINSIALKFIKGLKTFYKESITLTAYIIYHRKNKNNIILNDLSIKDLFNIDSDFRVTKKSNILSLLDKKTGVKTTSVVCEIRNIIKHLKSINDPKIYTRGKFELAYMVHCINSTPELLNTFRNKGDKKYSCCVSISLKNAVQILAPRVKHPKEIVEFLNKKK
ncbi:MAG: DUF4435 domain-containing protein [Candidatus Kapaibacterium sp.]